MNTICAGCFFHDQQTGCTDGRTEFDRCYVDPVDVAIEQRRQAEAVASDYFAANPRCQSVAVGHHGFFRRF